MPLRSDKKELIEDAELFEQSAKTLEARARDYRDIAKLCRDKAATMSDGMPWNAPYITLPGSEGTT